MDDDLEKRINSFLSSSPHAVVGASANRTKYGNKVLRVYQQNNRPALAINPAAAKLATPIEGQQAFASLSAAPQPIHGVSIITPPEVTEQVIEECARLNIRHVWMQPGAESPAAIARAEALGMNVIAGGPCILVVLGYSEH